jgi:hypothetical protein
MNTAGEERRLRRHRKGEIDELNGDRFETQFRVELTENLKCFGLKGFEGDLHF